MFELWNRRHSHILMVLLRLVLVVSLLQFKRPPLVNCNTCLQHCKLFLSFLFYFIKPFVSTLGQQFIFYFFTNANSNLGLVNSLLIWTFISENITKFVVQYNMFCGKMLKQRNCFNNQICTQNALLSIILISIDISLNRKLNCQSRSLCTNCWTFNVQLMAFNYCDKYYYTKKNEASFKIKREK